MTWSGQWVEDALDVRVRGDDDPARMPLGLPLRDLVGLAVRRNPRRAHLLVSRVLGKHVPTDPDLVYGSGRLLGVLVGQALGGRPVGDRVGGELLRAALAGVPGAAGRLVAHVEAASAPAVSAAVVLGYAETATALGHAVADALGAPYLHSTRRRVPGVTAVGGFEEAHSHAAEHLLLPADPVLLAGEGPLVLVDDELTTGSTALNTIAVLQASHPRGSYVMATLADLRSEADRARMAAFAEAHDTRIDVVALAAGSVELPDDILERGTALVAARGADRAGLPGGAGAVSRLEFPWPATVVEGGRHGFLPGDRTRLEEALAALADVVAARCGAAARVHVLGFEELMYAPLRLAQQVKARLAASASVTSSTTTSSPILAVDDALYPVRSRLAFPAHDDPAGGPATRYAYNIAAPPSDPAARFDVVVLVVDESGDRPELAAAGGLLAQLSAVAGEVLLVVLPEHRGTRP